MTISTRRADDSVISAAISATRVLPALVGKATGKDSEAGKGTLVSLFGIEAARVKLEELKAEALAALAPFSPRDGILAEAAEFVVARKF